MSCNNTPVNHHHDPLLPHHRHELEVGSGISPEVIERRGYRSVTAQEARNLGFADYQARAGLLIPQWSLAGVQVGYLLKPDQPRTDKDGKVVKYEQREKTPPRFDIHPDALPALRNIDDILSFTEGNKKGDAGLSCGLPFVCLAGVWQFVRGRLVVPDLDEIPLEGRRVRIIFDSDVTRKPSVTEALLRFAAALDRRGAKVEIIYLPEGPDGQKVGVDDWLVAGHTVDELDALSAPYDGSGPGVWMHYAGDQDPGEVQAVNRSIMSAILNPEVSRADLMVMASVAGQVMHKQAVGEVDTDGCVVLSAAEIADDYRPAPAKGERVRPVNPVTGTKPRMARERVSKAMEQAVERGLLPARPLPTIRQHANGTTYKTTDWVIDPVASFAELIDPWARYRQDQPKLRKPRTVPEACPECGEVHAIRRRDYCDGCGALVNEKLIDRPMPESNTSASDKLSEAETHSPSAPTHVRKVRQVIGGDPQPVPGEPAWLQDAPQFGPDDLSEADMSCDDDYGVDVPFYAAQDALTGDVLAAPGDAQRVLHREPRQEVFAPPTGTAGDDRWTWA